MQYYYVSIYYVKTRNIINNVPVGTHTMKLFKRDIFKSIRTRRADLSSRGNAQEEKKRKK